MKEYNFNRHYKSRHEAKYNNMRGQQREDKIKQLTKSVRWQQTAFTKLRVADHSVKQVI